MKNIFYLLLLLFPFALLAQPANDECTGAIDLPNVSSFCSPVAAFNNNGATLSSTVNPSCFPGADNDVWFSFVAIATDINIVVRGQTPTNAGGNLITPEFALYTGTCANLAEVQCSSDGFNTGVAESFAGPLTIGQRYFIRVDARDGRRGTFQLCVNNFNQVPSPQSDCPEGVVLCDKSPFTVQSITGTGMLTNEIGNGSCINMEHGSTWYKWTCKDAGTLSFTLTPTNPSDDLDFILFELPGGLNDCSNKNEIRCMASGENVGQPFSTWEPCTGPTGLSLTDTDMSEAAGCQAGNNNFVAAINMVPGRTYALVIDNFSNTGNGFNMEFGGTGTFQGPEADFTTAPSIVCQGTPVIVTNNSSSVNGIREQRWNFGIGANPATAVGVGPFSVIYTTPGPKSILLRVEDNSGCLVSTVQNLFVNPEITADIDVRVDYCDPTIATGDAYVTVTGGQGPFTFDFGNGFINDTFVQDIASGQYTVSIRDNRGCQYNFDFSVQEGLALEANADILTPPTCNGDSDGQIAISIEIGAEPFVYDIGNGPQSSNTFSGLPAGNYTVSVVDDSGCSGIFNLNMVDHPVLEVEADDTDISCNGETDGVAIGLVGGGLGPYTYEWSNNGTTEEIDGLSAGIYMVTVTDAAGCTITDQTEVLEPPPLELVLVDKTDVICFGDETGTIEVENTGGTPIYTYSTNGTNFQPSPIFNNLASNNYIVYVKDGRNCIDTIEVEINQPLELLVEAGPDQTINLGYSVTLNPVTGPPGRPVDYQWTPSGSLNCATCDIVTATPPRSTTYTVEITDETNCKAKDSVTIFVVLDRPIYIPNAFSPNESGPNDYFTVFAGPAVKSILSLKIFNRWGGLMWEGKDFPPNVETAGWDGTLNGEALNAAVFTYVAEIEFIDDVVIIFKGDVTLVK